MSGSAAALGAWRDRTNLFISYRQSYTHHPAGRTRFAGPSSAAFTDHADEERAGLISSRHGGGDAVIEMHPLPPRWLDMQDQVSQTLGDIAGKMRRLDQMHAKHILPGFDDESVKAREEREIEGLTQDITRDFVACQKSIRRIDRLVQEQQQQSGGTLSSADATMAKNLKMSLASRVGDASTLFRKKQSAYLKKMRSLGDMSSPLDRLSTPLAHNPYTDPAMMDSESDRSAAQSTLLQTAQVRRRGMSNSHIDQREREIEKIAQGVIDLSNLFQEIHTMVIDQGTVLDRIDYNVERAAEHVHAADKELQVATGYQKRSAKRKIILLLILVVVGMFILALLKPRKSGPPAPTPPAPPPPPPPTHPRAALPPQARRVRDVPSSTRDALNRRQWEWKTRRRRRMPIPRHL